MGETKKPFNEVLNDEQIKSLYVKCDYDKDNPDQYFSGGDFINGLSLVEYGDCDKEFGTDYSNIIDANGDFVNIPLDQNIKYAEGEIIKLNEEDRGKYYFKISRIPETKSNYEGFQNIVVDAYNATGFFVIKVERFTDKKDEDDLDLYYVINPELKVIATFSSTNTWGNEFDGYKNCNVFTQRDFYFISEDREFLVFAQKLFVNSDEKGFLDKHLAQIDPLAYEDIMGEYALDFRRQDYPFEDATVLEYNIDEEMMAKVISKDNDEIDEDDEGYDEIPYIEDIVFFFEDNQCKYYKDSFNEFYKPLYGIINCKIKAEKQLQPFTDKFSYARDIIMDRIRQTEFMDRYCLYGQGWDYHDKEFNGYVMQSKFFEYPPCIKGFTLRYLYDYYPSRLEWLVKNDFVLIPNKLLDTLGTSELTRKIRRYQEKHLSFSDINSVSDTIESIEYCGVISSFQGKTIKNVIYSKGGTKYLYSLLISGKIKIEKSVLQEFSTNADNDIEELCYKILLKVVEKIEYEEERYENWIQEQYEKDLLRDLNREFGDMMNEFDAWGNID